MHALRRQHPARKLMAGENVLPLQIGKLREQILDRIAAREVFENGLHRVTQPAHTRFPVANLRVHRDAGEQIFVRHGRTIRATFAGAKPVFSPRRNYADESLESDDSSIVTPQAKSSIIPPHSRSITFRSSATENTDPRHGPNTESFPFDPLSRSPTTSRPVSPSTQNRPMNFRLPVGSIRC